MNMDVGAVFTTSSGIVMGGGAGPLSYDRCSGRSPP